MAIDLTMLGWMGAAAFLCAFVVRVRQRQWDWFGLVVAICFAAKGWTHYHGTVSQRWVEGAGGGPLGLWALLYLLAVIGALSRPRLLWTWLVMVACAHMLFTGMVPLVRDFFDYDPAIHYLIAGQPVPQWLGIATTLLLAVVPGALGMPWVLGRQSRSGSDLLAAAETQYSRLFGVGVAVTMFLVPIFYAWALNSQGAHSGIAISTAYELPGIERRAGVNTIVAFVLLLIITVLWTLPRWFMAQTVTLIEAGESDHVGRLEELADPLWREFARKLDEYRRTANENRKEMEKTRATFETFFDHTPVFMALHEINGKIVLGTRTVFESYGASAAQLHAMKADQLSQFWPNWDELASLTAQVATTGELQRFTTPFRKSPEAEMQFFDITMFPIRSDDGEIEQIGTVGIDITQMVKRRREAEDARAIMQAFADNVPAGLTIKDRDRNFTMINEFSARSYYVAKPEDLIGKNAESLRTRRHGDHLHAMEQEVLDTGKTQSREVAYVAADGQQRHMNLMFFPIVGADGTITHIGSLTSDITEQRQTQSALAEQQENLLALFNYAPLQVYVTDLDHRIVMVNDWVHRETGHAAFHPDNVVGLSADQMVPASWAAMSHVNDDTVVAKRGVTQVEVRGEFGGKERDIISIRFPIRDAAGEVVRIGGFVVDVTRQKEAERALQERLAQSHQSEKLAALGQLLAGVAHELNNPLAAVLGQSSLLVEDLEGTEHVDRVGKIQRAAERCARIVQSFLAMARQKAPEHRSVEVAHLVRQALELTEYQMRAANISIDVELAPALPPIDADPDQLHQVIVNLLTNARQALEGTTSQPRITLSASSDGDRVTLRVADNGPGIAPDARARIFDPFYTTKEVGTGTGIGLSFSLGIVEAHGGTLQLEPGKSGTVFAITLPIAGRVAPVKQEHAQVQHRGKGRVLVIDDEADVAETLQDMLARLGLSVEVALGGREGQQILAGGAPFDLVISDIRMPVFDGMELFEWIKRHRPELTGSVVFATGDTLGKRVAEFMADADRPVLEKPFSRESVAALVGRMLLQ